MTQYCGALLILADDYGDNGCTFKCLLDEGHSGFHENRSRQQPSQTGTCFITLQWQGDDRIQQAWASYIWDILDDAEAKGLNIETVDIPETIPPDWDWRPYYKPE